MQRLASGVSIVTAIAPDGRPRGITASAVFSLTAEPPSLATSINLGTQLGKVAAEISDFSVNILNVRQQRIAEVFAGIDPEVSGADRFEHGHWRLDQDAPVLEDSSACFVCKVDGIVERSTHLLLIGLVTHVYVSEQHLAPLVYVSRQFTSVMSDPR
jgi:flavin reductase (DIM6/NTAB) family NADH-FMN oxidoreductase RutF